MKEVKIKITKNFIDVLVKMDIYDKWYENTKNNINEICSDAFLESHINIIQHAINKANIIEFLECSFNWTKSKEGFAYWNDIKDNIKNGKYL